LYLSGRKKFIIKQKGYNVFPGEVEEHIAQMAVVDVVEVIGMKHQLFDEGIFAFVRLLICLFKLSCENIRQLQPYKAHLIHEI